MHSQNTLKKHSRSNADFIKMFCIIFLIISAIVGFINYQQNSQQEFEQNIAEAQSFYKLPSPTPSPTINPNFPSYSRPLGALPTPELSPNNGSTYSPSYGNKTVSVRGYYRKNGTYVAPYTRSAPRRR